MFYTEQPVPTLSGPSTSVAKGPVPDLTAKHSRVAAEVDQGRATGRRQLGFARPLDDRFYLKAVLW